MNSMGMTNAAPLQFKSATWLDLALLNTETAGHKLEILMAHVRTNHFHIISAMYWVYSLSN